MKKAGFACVLLLALVLMPLQNISAEPVLPPGVQCVGNGVWVVDPQNSSPVDVQNVQAAVDMAAPGDIVRLTAGTFDFSEFDNVRIAKDLTIEGAWDAQNNTPLTIINHGYMPILIGRKTPVEKPLIEDVNGHAVAHITRDLWGKLAFPFAYPGMENYNVFDDWEPVTVNVRQIKFFEPYGEAIFIGAANGGVIEKVHIEGIRVMDSYFSFSVAGGMGIAWFGMGYLPKVYAEEGGTYYPGLYTGTDLIRGNIVVQDVNIRSDHVAVLADTLDENGLPYAVALAASPEPPAGDYEGYWLQDIPFSNLPGTILPDPASVQTFWVKKGNGAFVNLEDPANAGVVQVERGMWIGMAVLHTQANMLVRRNVMDGPGVGFITYENGFYDVPFNLLFEENKIAPSITEGWICSFCSVGFDHFNPATGETTHATAGAKLLLRKNTFTRTNPNTYFWNALVTINMYGQASIQRNTLDLESGSGLYVGWPVGSVNMLSNTFVGTGDYGVIADMGSDGNRVVLNDFSRFTPAGTGNWFAGAPPSQVILYSNENLVVGGRNSSAWVVIDFGQDNRVYGMTHTQMVFPAAASQSRAEQTQQQRMLDPFSR